MLGLHGFAWGGCLFGSCVARLTCVGVVWIVRVCLDLVFGLLRWILGWCVVVFGAVAVLVWFAGGGRGCGFWVGGLSSVLVFELV